MELCNVNDPYRYMINDEIIFNPDKRLLYRVDDEHNAETLNAPTAKCFLLLISRNGIVDQATIYSYVWGENESLITPNNLYQNISLIRRAISKLSPGLNLIKTIPRIGFSIDTDIKIEKISTEKMECHEGLGGVRSEQTLSVNSVPKNIPKKTTFHRPFIILLTILAAIVSIVFVSSTSRQSPYFLNYHAYLNEGGCHIYTSMATKRDIKFVIDDLTSKCEETPWNYVSYSSPFSDISVISCKKTMGGDEENDCKSSYLFMGEDV